MARKTKKQLREEAQKRRMNLRSKIQKQQEDLKIKRLTRGLYNRDRRGKITTRKKQLANIPAAEAGAPVNVQAKYKAKGLSNLPKDYKKQEKKAIKKVETWRKSDEYKKVMKERGKPVSDTSTSKTKKTSTGGGLSGTSRYVRDPKKGGKLVLKKSLRGKQILKQQEFRKKKKK